MSKKILFLLIVVCVLANSVYADEAKVLGGEKAPAEYPYQISLQVGRGRRAGLFSTLQDPRASEFSHTCGGSIVNENFIVTAAHCVEEFPIDRLSVLAGTTNLDDEAGGSRHMIDSCVVNPNHHDLGEFEMNDIAVCKLKTPFIYGKNIAPIELDTTYVGGGVNCTLTGWGQTSRSSDSFPRDLQSVTLTTITNDQCLLRFDVQPKQICTFEFGKGACDGDSGGPLYCNGALAGVTSYGYEICAFGQPDVFTRVSKYVDWINLNTILGAVSVSSIASTLGTNFTNNIFG
ncbi:unnamed protein product [Diamesa tonsa]